MGPINLHGKRKKHAVAEACQGLCYKGTAACHCPADLRIYSKHIWKITQTHSQSDVQDVCLARFGAQHVAGKRSCFPSDAADKTLLKPSCFQQKYVQAGQAMDLGRMLRRLLLCRLTVRHSELRDGRKCRHGSFQRRTSGNR